jgi:hypothetical protein
MGGVSKNTIKRRKKVWILSLFGVFGEEKQAGRRRR